MNRKLIATMLIAGMMAGTVTTAYASEQSAEAEVGNTVISQSNGNGGKNTNTGTDIDNHTSTDASDNSTNAQVNHTYTPTQNETNAYQEKNAVMDMLKKYIQMIKDSKDTRTFGMKAPGNHLSTLGVLQVPDTEIGQLLGHVSAFDQCMHQGDHADAFYNEQESLKATGLPHKALGEDLSVWNTLTQKEKDEIKKAIREKEGIDDGSMAMGTQINRKGTRGQDVSLRYDPKLTPPIAIRKGKGLTPYVLSDHTDVRKDLIRGGFQDSFTWSGRFDGLNRLVSNSMEDYLVMGYIEDYHIASVEKDHIEVIDYTSDMRVWSVYDQETGEKIKELTTDNPQHELAMKFSEPGKYRIVAEQEAKYQKGMYVKYDYIDYLFDAETKNLLYFNEQILSNDQGGSVFVGTTEETGLVPTGDVFNWTINDLGQVETDGSATQRVE